MSEVAVLESKAGDLTVTPRPAGRKLTSLPAGRGKFDRYDELLLVDGSSGTSIVEVATAKVTRIGTDFIHDIVYER